MILGAFWEAFVKPTQINVNMSVHVTRVVREITAVQSLVGWTEVIFHPHIIHVVTSQVFITGLRLKLREGLC